MIQDLRGTISERLKFKTQTSFKNDVGEMKTKRNSWLRFEKLSDLVGVWLEISQVRHV